MLFSLDKQFNSFTRRAEQEPSPFPPTQSCPVAFADRGPLWRKFNSRPFSSPIGHPRMYSGQLAVTRKVRRR